MGAEPRNASVYGGRELMYFLFHVTSLPETSLRPRADPPPTPLLHHSPFPQTLSQQRWRGNAQQDSGSSHACSQPSSPKRGGTPALHPSRSTEGTHCRSSSLPQSSGSHTEKGRSCGLGDAEAGGCSNNADLHKHTTISLLES